MTAGADSKIGKFGGNEFKRNESIQYLNTRYSVTETLFYINGRKNRRLEKIA
jgi:hypothetical protein